MGAVLSAVVSSLGGGVLSKLIPSDQKAAMEALKSYPHQDYLCDHQSNGCLQNVYGQTDSSDCLENEIGNQCIDKNEDQFLPKLAIVIISNMNGNQLKAKEDFGYLCELVTSKQCSHLPLNGEFEALTAIISSWKYFPRITPASFKSGLIPLCFDNSGISSHANVLNTLGILAIELSMPHKAIELFWLQHQYLIWNSVEFVGSLEEVVTLNNCGISHALIGQHKKATEYLDKARAIGSGMRKKSQVFDPCGLDVFVAVLNNLGRVNVEVGDSYEAENLLQEASEWLNETTCVMTTQQQTRKRVVVDLNIAQLFSTQNMWMLMEAKLQEIHESLCTLDLEDKLRFSTLVATELVRVYLKMKQNKKADEKLKTISPILTKLNLWTEDMIIDELDILLPIKVAEIFSLKGQIFRANDILKKALKMCRYIYGAEHPTTAELLYRRGWVCYLLEDYEECAALLLEATKIYKLCYHDNCTRLVSCYFKLAHVERFYLEEREKATKNVERAMGILSVFQEVEQQLQPHYLDELLRAITVDGCSSFHLTKNCITVSLSYYKVYFANHQAAGESYASSQSSETLQVSLNFRTKNLTDLLQLFTNTSLSFAQVGRTMESIRATEEALSFFSKQEGSGTSQMLLYSCLGFAQAVSWDENDRPHAEKNLKESLEISNELVPLLQRQQESDDLETFPTSDDHETVISSLAVMGQAYRALRGKEKEVMEVYKNLSVALSLGNDEVFNDTYTQVLGDRMMYMSADKLKSFQDKLVTVNVVVSEVPGMASLSACTPHNSSSYQPTIKVQCVDGHNSEQKVIVFAICQHQVDIEVLRSFSRSVSGSVRQRLNLRETLNQSFIIDFKPTISHKCHKAMCNELELVLPMYMAEELVNSGNQDRCSSSNPRPDTVCQTQFCSGFSRYSTSSHCSSEVLLGRFVLACIKKSDQLGVICDLSLTNNSLSLFLLEPKASIQLQCLGSVFETHTRFLCPLDCDGCQNTSKLCGCSDMDKTVTNILAESSRSVGVELDLRVDNRQCCTLSEKPVDQQLRSLVECENQQPPWKEEKDEEKFMSDVKGELQTLRKCLKKSKVNVAVLQGLMAGRLSQGDSQLPSAKGEDHTTCDTIDCNAVSGGASHGAPQWRGGASAFEPVGAMMILQDSDVRGHSKTRKVKMPQDLHVADSGIDSSDSEKKGATLEVRSGQSAPSSDEQVNCIVSSTSELCNLNLPVNEVRNNHQSEGCGYQSCISTAPDGLAETAAGRTRDWAGRYSPLSSSTEDEDLSTGKSTLNTRQKSPRHFRCRSTEKQPIKQWHKTEKLREAASLQRTIERLERTVQLMKGEMREMEKNYGEALVERDSALKTLEIMKFERELEQRRRRRRREHTSGVADDERQEDTGPGPGGCGIRNSNVVKDKGDSRTRSAGRMVDGDQRYVAAAGDVTQHLKTIHCNIPDGDQEHGVIGCIEDRQWSMSTFSKQEDFDKIDGQSTIHPRIISHMCDSDQQRGTTEYSEYQQRRSVSTCSKQEDSEETDGQSTAYPKIFSHMSDSDHGTTEYNEDQQRKCVNTSSNQEDFEKTDGHSTADPRIISHMSDSDHERGTIGCSEDQQRRSVSTSSKQEDFDETDGQPTALTRIISHMSYSDRERGAIGCSEDQQRRSVSTSSMQEDFDETDGQPTALTRIISHMSDSEDQQRRSLRTSGKQQDFDETDGHPTAHPTIISHMSDSDQEPGTIGSSEDQQRTSMSTFIKQKDLKWTDDYPTSHPRIVSQKMNCFIINVGEEATLEIKGNALTGTLVDADKSGSCRSMTGGVSKQHMDLPAKENKVTSPRCEQKCISDSFDELCDASDGLPSRISSCQLTSSTRQAIGQVVQFTRNKTLATSLMGITHAKEHHNGTEIVGEIRPKLESEEVKVSTVDNHSVLKQNMVKGAELLNKADLGKDSCSPERKELKTDHPNVGEGMEVTCKEIIITSVRQYSFSNGALKCKLSEPVVCERDSGEGKVGEIDGFRSPEILPHHESVCKDNTRQDPSAGHKAGLPQVMSDKLTQSEKDEDKDVPHEGVAVPCKPLTKQTDCGAKSVGGVTKVTSASFSGVQSNRTYLGQGARPKQTQSSSTQVTPDATLDVQNSQAFLEQGARPKRYQQSAAGHMSRERSGRNDSLLVSSPDDYGLDVAFLARHSQDCSISLHSHQASDDFYLSPPPLEWNQNGSASRSNMPRHVDLDQQYLTSNSQLIPTDYTAKVVPEIPRNLWEVPNTGGASTFSAQRRQMADPRQQSRSLFDYQSAVSSRPVAFPHPTEIHPCEPPGSSSASLSFSDKILSRHAVPGWQPQTDPLIASTASGNPQVTHATTVGSSSVHTQGESKNRFSNTVGDVSTCEKNGGKKGKNSFSCEETDKTVEDLPLEDEVETAELANLSISGTESFQSVEETLNTLESRVAEACAMVERVFRERRSREQEAMEREEREREEREQVFREQEEREREEEERAARGGQDRHITTDTAYQEPEIDGERYPVQESPQWLCEHYQRRCKVRFSCCNLYHPCHRCHNSSDRCSNVEAKAHEATHLQCIVCREEQPVTDNYETQTCQSCGTKLSEYFCPKCKHFTGIEKKPYHCDKCGICRIHKDRSFHCEVCNVCLDKRLQGKHKCRPDSGHDECCICLEDAFSGCQILPCSHKVHRDCAIAMIRNGIRTCPVCRHPLYSAPDEQ